MGKGTSCLSLTEAETWLEVFPGTWCGARVKEFGVSGLEPGLGSNLDTAPLAVPPWLSPFTSLCISVLTCKLGVITASATQVTGPEGPAQSRCPAGSSDFGQPEEG